MPAYIPIRTEADKQEEANEDDKETKDDKKGNRRETYMGSAAKCHACDMNNDTIIGTADATMIMLSTTVPARGCMVALPR